MITLVNAKSVEKHTYAIKSGYVKYKLTGNTKGTKELWWDDYGRKEKKITKSKTVTSMFGMTSEEKEHILEITKDGIAYIINYEENTNSKMRLPNYGQTPQNDLTEEEQEKLAEQTIKSLGGEKLGNEKVLSYDCKVYSLMGMKTWVYKGVTLKMEGELLGIKTKETAVEFKPKKSISSSEFDLPKGVKFKDINKEMNKQMGGNASDNPFASLSEGMNQQEDMDDDNEDDSEEVIPTKYPYEKFKSKVSGLKEPGYSKVMLSPLKGIHTAIFAKGGLFGMAKNSITILAMSKENGKNKNTKDFETFKHNGHECMYGKSATEKNPDEEATYLIIDIDKYDTYIMIMTVPVHSKKKMLKIANKLNF